MFLISDRENDCSICMESKSEKENMKLKCGHEFHRECIGNWFKVNKTCPNCRNYEVLDEDFPALQKK